MSASLAVAFSRRLAIGDDVGTTHKGVLEGGDVWTVVAGVCGVEGEVCDLYLYGGPHRVARWHQVAGLITFGNVLLPGRKAVYSAD